MAIQLQSQPEEPAETPAATISLRTKESLRNQTAPGREVTQHFALRRKKRLISALKKQIEAVMDKDVKPYPDILKTLHTLKIPFPTFQLWKQTDPDFLNELDNIEEIYLEECVKIVNNAAPLNPYLALDLLRTRRRAKYGAALNVNATFTHIHMVSNVNRPNKPPPEDAELTE